MECLKYGDPSAKLTKLKAMNHCLKCGYGNHTTYNCNFSFLWPCSICSKQHFSYFCNNANKNVTRQVAKAQNGVSKSEPKNKNNKGAMKGTVNQLIQFAIQNEEFEKVVLPTFTVEATSNSGKSNKLKCLIDTASQSSFILKDVAKSMKLEVVQKNIKVNIFGFNEAKTYLTDLVALDIFINNVKKSIHAICVPQIRTGIDIPELKTVVSKFKSKGHLLADENLGEGSCNGIQLLLGMDNSQVLSFETVPYGDDKSKSILLKTPLGSVLLGNVVEMINNLEHIPEYESPRA